MEHSSWRGGARGAKQQATAEREAKGPAGGNFLIITLCLIFFYYETPGLAGVKYFAVGKPTRPKVLWDSSPSTDRSVGCPGFAASAPPSVGEKI